MDRSFKASFFSAEMIGFQVFDPSMGYVTHNLTIRNQNISTEYFQSLQRGHFIETDGYGPFNRAISTYKPPPLELYTKFSLQAYFLSFWVILFIQNLAIFIIDTLWVKTIPENTTLWERLIHAIVKSHFPFPFTNWHEAKGNCKDHVQKQKEAQHEVLVTTAVNLIFNMILLIPFVILCKS